MWRALPPHFLLHVACRSAAAALPSFVVVYYPSVTTKSAFTATFFVPRRQALPSVHQDKGALSAYDAPPPAAMINLFQPASVRFLLAAVGHRCRRRRWHHARFLLLPGPSGVC